MMKTRTDKILEDAFRDNNKKRAAQGLPPIPESDWGVAKQMILTALSQKKLADSPKIWRDIAPYVDRDPTIKTLSDWIAKVKKKRNQGETKLGYYESWIINHL
jgi:hypothetical protein